jgi:hypothetical protein
MGCSYHVKRLQCGQKFKENSGGGFFFHCLHCDTCGAYKSIGFGEIGEAHLRFIKGLPGPYCVASSGQDQYIKDNYPGEPMSEEEYYAAVEQIVGGCGCGGSHKFDSPPRCPKCRSAGLEYDPAGPYIMYD